MSYFGTYWGPDYDGAAYWGTSTAPPPVAGGFSFDFDARATILAGAPFDPRGTTEISLPTLFDVDARSTVEVTAPDLFGVNPRGTRRVNS